MPTYFGYVSGIAIAVSFAPYILAIFRRGTRPERASWFIWAILGGIFFFSQLAKGADNSLWLPGVQAVGDFSVFILAIKYGMGGWRTRDKMAIGAAGVSLLLWFITKEAAVALFLAISIDAAGGVLTIAKSYRYPTTEPLFAWILTAVGGFFAILSVGSFDPILLAFPVYTFLINLAIAGSIEFGRMKIKRVAA